jgi:hypothetical protein
MKLPQLSLRDLFLLVLIVGFSLGCNRPNAPKAETMNAEQPWPFDQAPNVAAITTRQVLEGHPILRVVHYEDDHSWAFTCGTTDDESDGRVASMKSIVQRDESLKEIADLPPGWKASCVWTPGTIG